jgi:hemolysin activation/secretion protein
MGPCHQVFDFHRRLGPTLCVALLAGLGGTGVWAQANANRFTEVNAGSLRQQIERDQTFKLPKISAPTEAEKKPLNAQETKGPKIAVKQFVFKGNTLLSSDKLAAAVARYQGESLSFAQLEQAVAEVAQAYRYAGCKVRDYLPEQDIVDGAVTVNIVEAVFGKVIIEGALPPGLDQARLIKIVLSEQTTGTFLRSSAVDRALLIADDISGVAVTGGLQEGQRDGETDVVLKGLEKPWLETNFSHDNTGSESTGVERTSLGFTGNSWLMAGDVFSTQLVGSEGTRYVRLSESIPIGYTGLRMGVNASRMTYRVGLLGADGFEITGLSESFGVETSYPLVRSRLSNLYANLAVDNKIFRNFSSDKRDSDYSIRSTALGLSGNLFDNFGGGGFNNASLTLTHGTVNMDGSGNFITNPDSFPEGKLGFYRKLRYALSRQQSLTDQLAFYLALSGQSALSDLDSSEKFYLGGSSGVRAYPSSEGGGVKGHMVNAELRWQVASGYSATAFYDYGQVLADPLFHTRDNQEFINEYSLKGGGLAFSRQFDGGFTLKLTWARRSEDNPNPRTDTTTLQIKDQSGSLVRDRVWLSLSASF